MVAAPTFVRDRFTWLAYAMLAYYGYYIAALGPLVPFLRAELDLSYTTSGLHVSAYAGGVAVAGVLGARIAGRWGRWATFWLGGAGMALGTIGLVLGWTIAITLVSVLLMGASGGLLLIMIQSTLADHHGDHRTRALTEANVIAVLCGSFAPLLIGTAEQIGLGWRSGLWLAVIAFVLLFAAFGRITIADAAPDPDHAATAKLPTTFWFFWLIIFLAVAIEWCVQFWAAAFLVQAVGLADTSAASAVSVFLIAMVIGRFTGSILARHHAASRLLLVALGIVVIGFPVFWLAPIAPLNIIGLFVAGLGVANLYPLGLAIAMGIAPHLADLASARLTLASSMATLFLPFVLGTVADRVGIMRAFSVVLLLVVCAIVVLALAGRATARSNLRAVTP